MTDSRVEALLRVLREIEQLVPNCGQEYHDMVRLTNQIVGVTRAALASPLPEPASECSRCHVMTAHITVTTCAECGQPLESLSQGAPEPRYEKDLAHLATLGPNWDSYGGVPITAKAIAAVRDWIRDIQICPRSNGGLQIELAARPGAPDHDVAFEPDGTIEQHEEAASARGAPAPDATGHP